ncbi:MAG TPA: SDR family oxidoreductase [Polyangiaceae bacterium]|nr:SDR family oxidoreductase [Polyangiaceae bacterium]
MTATARPSAFDLSGRVVLITGGAGLLGAEHASAIAEAGGIPVIADLRGADAEKAARAIRDRYGGACSAIELDVTSRASCEAALAKVLDLHGRLDGLVNNAALNPKVEGAGLAATRFENYSLELWNRELSVGLSGAFLCAQVFGAYMAAHGGGVIVNIASDLGIIAPDQRIYRRPGLAPEEQPVKPVTYSVVKGGLVMLTKYLATYWADAGVRVNALVPGGVYAGQPEDFVEKLTQLIPMGRMARKDEYRAALVFLCSDASSYMTGSNLVIDGGRTCW